MQTIQLTDQDIASLRQCILFAAKNADLPAMKTLCALDDRIAQQIATPAPEPTAA